MLKKLLDTPLEGTFTVIPDCGQEPVIMRVTRRQAAVFGWWMICKALFGTAKEASK